MVWSVNKVGLLKHTVAAVNPATGFVLMVTVTVFELVQLFASVTVTVYVVVAEGDETGFEIAALFNPPEGDHK